MYGSSGQQLERPETQQSRADAADSCGVGCNFLLHLDSFGQPRSDAHEVSGHLADSRDGHGRLQGS